MSLAGQYTILSFLWNNTDGHDKVWGYFQLSSDPTTYYNFWGRRGKKLTWKEYKEEPRSWRSYAKLKNLAAEKVRKGGYQEVAINQIEVTTPGFTDEFEKNFTLARLFDNFHKKVEEA